MQQDQPVATTDAPFLFCPDWGAETWHLWKLVSAARVGELPDTLEALLRAAPAIESLSEDQLKVAFSTSLLSDILRAGGKAWVRESRLFVSWPDWGGKRGRESARIAMSAARDLRPLTPLEVGRGMVQMLRKGEFPTGTKVLYAHLSGVPELNAESFLHRNY
jgi:hypothetical protein